MFIGYLALLKTQYYFSKVASDDGVVFLVLFDGLKLDQHASFFVVTMKCCHLSLLT
jgi:hypothetical protein